MSGLRAGSARRAAIAALVVAAVVAVGGALASCGLEPDVGELLAGRCSDADSQPDVAVSFSYQVRPLLNRPNTLGGCGCHIPSAAGSVGIQLSGLDLGSLSSLRAGGLASGPSIVIPMQPCASVLYQKVDEAPPFGSRMPLSGPPFLSEAEIDLIHDWIAEGAKDN
jgi:hypothetical protein